MRQLAAVQLDLGAPQDALASITKSIEVSPNASGLIYTGSLTLANVYAALGDAPKAQAYSTRRSAVSAKSARAMPRRWR